MYGNERICLNEVNRNTDPEGEIEQFYYCTWGMLLRQVSTLTKANSGHTKCTVLRIIAAALFCLNSNLRCSHVALFQHLSQLCYRRPLAILVSSANIIHHMLVVPELSTSSAT